MANNKAHYESLGRQDARNLTKENCPASLGWQRTAYTAARENELELMRQEDMADFQGKIAGPVTDVDRSAKRKDSLSRSERIRLVYQRRAEATVAKLSKRRERRRRRIQMEAARKRDRSFDVGAWRRANLGSD